MQKKRNQGQIMILSVLLISGAVLSATSLAGFLVLFQLRQTGDALTSARAVFAADAGIERALYEKFVLGGGGCPAVIESDTLSEPEAHFVLDDLEYIVQFEGDCGAAKSAGRSARSARAFNLSLDGLCAFGGQLDELLCPPES